MPVGVYPRVKPVSEETRKKISDAQKGRKHSEETKKKLSLRRTGKPFPHEGRARSESTRLKISLMAQGRKLSPEHKEKIRRTSLGRKHTEEARLKISLAKRGDATNLWRGGKTTKSKITRMSVEYRVWREQVFKRDDYTCQDCGIRGGRLDPHHIKSFSTHPELWFDVDNGQTLCRSCHKKTESYGRKNV